MGLVAVWLPKIAFWGVDTGLHQGLKYFLRSHFPNAIDHAPVRLGQLLYRDICAISADLFCSGLHGIETGAVAHKLSRFHKRKSIDETIKKIKKIRK